MQQRGAPERKMNTMNPARPPRPLLPNHQDTVKTYAQVARGLRNREESFGSSPSQHQARQEPQEGSRQKINHVASTPWSLRGPVNQLSKRLDLRKPVGTTFDWRHNTLIILFAERFSKEPLPVTMQI
ncbi:hypothetical protein HPB52_023442 [Rhipicephalus sanguineus]|uniref:Uncharacterized protein n=1 Tax=Rhipicephalus sanguineus TaxID=34632 RepID=A0A9D4Q3M4_RHISA|nr:hypothetical protein HPB52_023442 [Rhipicephalus sanguineus]